MSLLEKLCKEIGVEVEEVWMGNDGKHYYINGRGYLVNKTKEGYTYTDHIERVLSGELKPAWEPNEGERYFIPFIGYNSLEDVYDSWVWKEGSRVSEWHKEKSMIFRTKEEAMKMGEKILCFIKEARYE